mmetsp:Transcript_24518/g.61703  ORF Transcript_24518/g.61703 Transcript_24518/m.61703 type:complete len:277 (-) Transcript_24518:3964-4794(-)
MIGGTGRRGRLMLRRRSGSSSCRWSVTVREGRRWVIVMGLAVIETISAASPTRSWRRRALGALNWTVLPIPARAVGEVARTRRAPCKDPLLHRFAHGRNLQHAGQFFVQLNVFSHHFLLVIVYHSQLAFHAQALASLALNFLPELQQLVLGLVHVVLSSDVGGGQLLVEIVVLALHLTFRLRVLFWCFRVAGIVRWRRIASVATEACGPTATASGKHSRLAFHAMLRWAARKSQTLRLQFFNSGCDSFLRPYSQPRRWCLRAAASQRRARRRVSAR